MRTSVAALVGVAGMALVGLPPAHAAPLSECVEIRYPERQIVLEQDNNIEVTSHVAGAGFSNPITYVLLKPGNNPISGDVDGGWKGTQIDFTVHWNNGFTNHYVGQIRDDGSADGTTTNNLGTTNEWTAKGRFECQDQAPQYTATISARTDLYDFPNGKVISWLDRGTPVNVLQVKDGNWLKVSGTQVPNGIGWVKGDFVIRN